jgi:hypothetical protein
LEAIGREKGGDMGEAEAVGCKRFRLATLGCKKDLWKDAE